MNTDSAQIPDTAHPSILIVDDEESNRQLLERVFRQNYRMVNAANGEQALEQLGKNDFDVMLLDIMMPGMDGLKVLKIVREELELDDLPIIMLTALSDADDVVNGLQLGANDYITKPFALEVLQARVETQIKLKRLTDEHKRVNNELEALQKMRMRFFRMATHDLRSPLANIQMAAHLLRETCTNDVGGVLLDTITVTARTMESVVGDFLEMAVLQGGQIQLIPEYIPSEIVLWDLVTQYNGLATEKQIALDVESAEGGVFADSNRLAQILGNLISNAIKYSPQRTTVRLGAEPRGEFIRFSVADEGPGIPEKERDRLFTEFGRLSTRPTAGESSTGLGLWSVKQLVALHGGSVGVECPQEGGSVFWVDLPSHLDGESAFSTCVSRAVATC